MTPEQIKQMTYGIAVSALGVGSIIAGKRYYDNWKLRNTIEQVAKKIDSMYVNCFTIDRLIDADCNGKVLSVGVNGDINPNNILSRQGIRLGQDGQIKRLVSYSKTENGLVYNFEDNYRLTLNKTDKNTIVYSFEGGNDKVVKEMADIIRRTWKPISLGSTELDKISELK